MRKDILIKDRKKEIEILRMALNLSEIWMDYESTDLLVRVQDKLNKKKGKFSLNDGVEIFHKWKEEYREYYKKFDENVIK